MPWHRCGINSTQHAYFDCVSIYGYEYFFYSDDVNDEYSPFSTPPYAEDDPFWTWWSLAFYALFGIGPMLIACWGSIVTIRADREIEKRRLEEIDQLVETSTFEWGDDLQIDNATCVCCLDDFQEGEGCLKLPCGHHFHKECIVSWMHTTVNQARKCPLCKQKCLTHDFDDRDEDDDHGSLFAGIFPPTLLLPPTAGSQSTSMPGPGGGHLAPPMVHGFLAMV